MKTIILFATMLISLSSFAQSNILRSKSGLQFISCIQNKCLSQLKTYYDMKDDYNRDYTRVITENGEFELDDLNVLISELEEEITDREIKMEASREKLKKLGYRKKKLERIMKIFEEVMIEKELLHQGLVNLKANIKSSKPSENIVPMFHLHDFILFKAASYKMLDIDIENSYPPSR